MANPLQENFDHFGYVVIARGETPERARTTFPGEWQTKYFADRLYLDDPTFSFSNKHKRTCGAALLSHAEMATPLFEEARPYSADSNFVCVSHIGGSQLVLGAVNHDLDERAIPACLDAARRAHRLELMARLERLTECQLDVLDLSDDGLHDKEIAAELGVSMSAIAQRKKAICNHMGLAKFQAAVSLYTLTKWGGIVADADLTV